MEYDVLLPITRVFRSPYTDRYDIFSFGSAPIKYFDVVILYYRDGELVSDIFCDYFAIILSVAVTKFYILPCARVFYF